MLQSYVRSAAVCLFAAGLTVAQHRVPGWIGILPEHGFERLPGRWHYASEFRSPAVAGHVFGGAIADLRSMRLSLPQRLAEGYVALEQHYEGFVARNGQESRTVAEEDTLWMPADGNTFSWRKTSISGGEGENGPFTWQVCVGDGWVASRTDTKSGIAYTVMDRGGDNTIRGLYLFQQIRAHRSVIEYFVRHGRDEGRGYALNADAVDAVQPDGFPMPLTASRGFMKLVQGPRGEVDICASLFDRDGRLVSEWASMWAPQGIRSLAVRRFVETTGVLAEEVKIKIIGLATEVHPPDPVAISVAPTRTTEAYDYRAGQDGLHFDPRHGIPAIKGDEKDIRSAKSYVTGGNDSVVDSKGKQPVVGFSAKEGGALMPPWIGKRLEADRVSPKTIGWVGWFSVCACVVVAVVLLLRLRLFGSRGAALLLLVVAAGVAGCSRERPELHPANLDSAQIASGVSLDGLVSLAPDSLV